MLNDVFSVMVVSWTWWFGREEGRGMFLLNSTMTTFVSGLQYSNIYKHDIYDFYDFFVVFLPRSTFLAFLLYTVVAYV